MLSRVPKDGAVEPYNDIDYNWYANGIHHDDAMAARGKGGLGDIVGQEIPIGHDHSLGYYEGKVVIYDPLFKNNKGWKKKNSKKSMSTFFPKTWSAQRVKEEMALAFMRKKFFMISSSGEYKYIGQMSDGVWCLFYVDNGVISTAFPIFKVIHSNSK